MVAPSVALAPFDASRVSRLLDDPRLADAQALVAAQKPLDAARSVAKVGESADPSEKALFAHVEGHLRLVGGDPRGASAAFDRAASVDSPIRAYAQLASAEALSGLGDHAGAVSRAALADGHVLASRLDPVYARSLIRAGKIDEGLARFRKAMGPSPKKNPKIALELSRALLAHPGQGHAVEALRIATAVDLDAPRSKVVDDAKKLVDQARAVTTTDEQKAVDGNSPEVTGARLAASGQGKRALVILDRLSQRGSLGCVGLSGRADALVSVKRFSEASEEYGRASEACARVDAAMAAPELERRDAASLLFAGARAAAKGGDQALAKRRYAELEHDFASSRLADDARLERARLAVDGGDLAAADALVATMATDYPAGDVVKDALFLVGIAHAARGEWAASLPLFTSGAAQPLDRAYERAGRFTYFRGRALLATGKRDEGRAELEKTVRTFPCGYYAALAVARVEALAGAKASLPEPAPSSNGSTSSLAAAVPVEVSTSPAWLAAIDLVRADDTDLALAALAELGVSDRSAAPETLGASAALLARSKDPTPAHMLLRSAFEVEARPGKNEFRAFRNASPTGDALALWRIAYPKPFAAEVARASQESGVSESLIYAIMREESAFSPVALSKAGAVGLLQLMPPTARKMGRGLGLEVTDASLRDPAVNVRLGARFLGSMQKRFADDPLLAIPAYNAGPGAPETWTSADPTVDFDLFVEAIPYAETRAYTKRVIASLAAYQTIYAEGGAQAGLGIPERARAAP